MGKIPVGIVGNGVVGRATGMIFKPDWIYDPPKGYSGYSESAARDSVVFVCAPTVCNKDGCDLDPVVNSVFRFRHSRLIVLRSSVPPGTAKRLAQTYGANIISNPEFLREASAEHDTLHPHKIVLGHDGKDGDNLELIKDMYRKSAIDWSCCYGFIETDNTTAELIKFVGNLLGATKVSLANEIYDVCQKIGANFEDVRRTVSTDSRLGNGFFAVTEKRGWGGRCFPKDMQIFLRWLEDNGMESLVLTAARNANLKYRRLGDES